MQLIVPTWQWPKTNNMVLRRLNQDDIELLEWACHSPYLELLATCCLSLLQGIITHKLHEHRASDIRHTVDQVIHSVLIGRHWCYRNNDSPITAMSITNVHKLWLQQFGHACTCVCFSCTCWSCENKSHVWFDFCDDEWITKPRQRGDLHVSVRQVLKVVSTDALVGVWCEDGPAVTQTPQALDPNTFPRVQQVSIQVLGVRRTQNPFIIWKMLKSH